MSENPLLNPSSDSSSKTPGLNPVLATALASLEVQLDQELARYRRTRIGSKTPNAPRINSISSKSLGLHLFSSTENKTQLQVPNPEKVTAKLSEQLQSAATGKNQTTSPSNSSSIVPATVKGDNSSAVVTSVDTDLSIRKTNVPDATNNNSQEPDDYLESSEALLRSLTEEQEQKTTQVRAKNISDSLLSPLGIGSMLLLLAASLTLSYVLFNPKSLPKFSLHGLFQRQTSNTEGNTGVVKQNTSNQPQTQISPISKYPNLATKEFPEINNSNDIVGLTPKAKPNPVIPPPPKKLPVAVTPVQLKTKVTPKATPKAKPISTPNKTPKPQVSQPPLTQIKPSADGFYHIVTNNQDDQTFSKAKAIVGDAYLSDNKKLIYLGAVKNKARAEKLLQQLKAKGINARIKQP